MILISTLKILKNNESVAYREINEALSLTQCNNLATHRVGHNKDHVFVENEGQVINCETGSFMSNHCMVNFTLTIPKENVKNESVTFRNSKKLDRDKFCELLKFNRELSDLNDLV